MEISTEQLSKELDEFSKVSYEILQDNANDTAKRMMSNPSAIAVTATLHDTGDTINTIRKTPKQLYTLYYTNQFVSRPINVRAESIVANGYRIIGEDSNGVKACEELIRNSGGQRYIKTLAKNAFISGDAFDEKVYNIDKTKILKLRQVHPVTIKFKTDVETDRIILDPKTKEPKGYVQKVLDESNVEVEKDVPKDRIAHFMFDTIGDEFTGFSLLQSGYDTIVRLMNMEYSAAEAAVKTANPMWVATCNTKSPHQIAQWSQILGKITGKDQLFIPDGMIIDMKSPGPQNFNEYANYFLDAVVSAFGVPRGVFLGSGGSGSNRAEEIVLMRQFYSSIRENQRSLEEYFNTIFEEYASLAGFKAPKFLFEDVAEDANLNANSAVQLFTSGIISREEAREMIGLERDENNEAKVNIREPVSDEIKKSDMQTWHNNDGQPAGSQVGEKTEMKNNDFSEFRGNDLPNVKLQ